MGEAVAFDVLLENPGRRSKLFGGDRSLTFARTIRIILKDDPTPFQFICKAGKAGRSPDPVGGGFNKPRALLGMKPAFPMNPADIIAPEMWWRLSLFVEREMLVIEVDLRVEKIGTILPMMLGGGIMLIGAFVLVVDSMIEEPVGYHPLLFTFDDLAIGGENAPPPVAIGVGLRRLVP